MFDYFTHSLYNEWASCKHGRANIHVAQSLIRCIQARKQEPIHQTGVIESVQLKCTSCVLEWFISRILRLGRHASECKQTNERTITLLKRPPFYWYRNHGYQYFHHGYSTIATQSACTVLICSKRVSSQSSTWRERCTSPNTGCRNKRSLVCMRQHAEQWVWS